MQVRAVIGLRPGRLVARFARNERGAFATIFAVLAIVLVATAGSAVDFTALQHARGNAQEALDAAALALQPSIYTASAATIQTEAQGLLLSRLDNGGGADWLDCSTNGGVAPCAHVETPLIDTEAGQLTLAASLKVSMAFVRLVGVPTISTNVISGATRKKLTLEVAMVLDNSGSMANSFGSGTRMSVLQASAKCAANILFYDVSTCAASTTGLTASPDVKIAVVPFTMEVNVGTNNADAAWIDRAGTGTGSITPDNFDSDDYDGNVFAGPVDRIALFNTITYNGTPLQWGGCVEARRSPYDTTDTPPDPANPETLFTPFFAPDEPGNAEAPGSGSRVNGDRFYNSYIGDTGPSCNREPVVVQTTVKTGCSYRGNSASGFAYNCSGATTTSYRETDQTGANSTITSLPAQIFNNPLPSSHADAYAYQSTRNGYTNTRTRTYTYVFSNREYQERLCKYDGTTMAYAPNVTYAYGPNSDCPAAPVAPLAGSPSAVSAAIDAMAADGGTNITQGTAWGWRTLSPGAPFTQGAPYGAAISKVMIVMTDGENTAYQYGNMNDSQFYSAYGYPWNSTENGRPANTRLGAADSTNSELEGEMNARLGTVCTNAKAAGITIYTIGIATDQTSDPSANQALLTACATDSGKAFFPNSATDLQDTFVKIANQLAALRLSR